MLPRIKWMKYDFPCYKGYIWMVMITIDEGMLKLWKQICQEVGTFPSCITTSTCANRIQLEWPPRASTTQNWSFLYCDYNLDLFHCQVDLHFTMILMCKILLLFVAVPTSIDGLWFPKGSIVSFYLIMIVFDTHM